MILLSTYCIPGTVSGPGNTVNKTKPALHWCLCCSGRKQTAMEWKVKDLVSQWQVLWIKIVQTQEQECPSMGEGKLVLINGIVREGFTDKVVFEKMPDKREWKSKGLSSRNWIIGTENSKCKGKVARLSRTSSNTGRSSFSEFCDLAEGWHWGGGTLSLHSKPCDWCPQKLRVRKRNAEMRPSIVFLIYR